MESAASAIFVREIMCILRCTIRLRRRRRRATMLPGARCEPSGSRFERSTIHVRAARARLFGNIK
jgi:hypothetical protein